MKRFHWLMGLAGIAVLALAFVLGRGGSTPGTAGAREEAAKFQYNFVANDVTVRQTDNDGTLQYRLEAERVEQRPEDRQISVTNLTAHYEAANGKQDAPADPVDTTHWKLTAEHATLPDDGKLLQLRGSVRVMGQPPAATAPVTIATDSLDYDTQTQEITSHEIVEMQMGGQKLQGLGLQANIRLSTVRLETEVHGDITR
jgi:LPS export ABC transporter protein LptC